MSQPTEYDVMIADNAHKVIRWDHVPSLKVLVETAQAEFRGVPTELLKGFILFCNDEVYGYILCSEGIKIDLDHFDGFHSIEKKVIAGGHAEQYRRALVLAGDNPDRW